MEMSQHARIRIRQRGITEAIVNLITEYGTPVERKGNALEYSLNKKQTLVIIEELRCRIGALQKAMNKAVLVSEDTGDIITVYHKTRQKRG
ncbi:MAG: hypothetical protein C0392_02840 [Syntrophus sp. (in: bacteria)]|nr:hypothetical protein [Syntrophus sp. (in: bacteria)]